MPKLLIHPSSQLLIDEYVSEPTHAVMLTGDRGVGLNAIAHELANVLTDEVYLTDVVPEEGKSGIAIESIRRLYSLAKIKDEHRRMIIIDNAETMSTDAQNALLKLLEEPVERVHFILTSHDSQLLLATIHSRVQIIPVRPIGHRESAEFLHSLNIADETKEKQIAFIAQGLPAEMKRLAESERYFENKSAKAAAARAFLGAMTYERLLLIAKYSSRDEALEFLEMLGKFAVHTLYRQPNASTSKQLDAVAETVERIEANGNVRTQLTRLVSQWS